VGKATSYVLYLDDSGTKEYAASLLVYSRTGNTRYFVFGGVPITTTESGRLAGRIEDLKRTFFRVSDLSGGAPLF
jgi:hypothetical protein